ncbi:MAG: hypothetical protein K6C13_10285 [Oscillospiraceae bacterium]|nr:hypothetical protein [Oscillospiraceae bacterium]
MSFPIVSPSFYRDLTDPTKKENDGIKYNVTISPVAIEYSFPLYQEKVVRKLMEIKEPISFVAQDTIPEKVKRYTEERDELILKYNYLSNYGLGKAFMMNAIQDRNYSIEKRMLLMNFMSKSVQNAIDRKRDREIPGFVKGFVEKTDRSEIMEFFSRLSPNFRYSVMDAFSVLRGMPSTPAFDEVRKTVFAKLGFDEKLSQPEGDTFSAHVDEYIELKRAFSEDFLRQGKEDSREYYLENVMVNYIWTLSMPYADYSHDMWDNFMFFNIIFNTIKVMLTCYITPENSDEDFVRAITAFDESMESIRGSMVDITVRSVEKRGLDNNGDMAVLALS